MVVGLLARKLVQVEDAKSSSLSAESEIFMAFSFCEAFSFAPVVSKEKADFKSDIFTTKNTAEKSAVFLFIQVRRHSS